MENLRYIFRLISIAKTLARYDLLFLLDHLGHGSAPRIIARTFLPRPNRTARALRQGKRLAKALQELGPSFIKFGQTWSTRADIIGDQTADDLSELRDRLPPFPLKEVNKILEKTFGKNIEDLFRSFNPEPVAAASIAQVHLAITADGREVAVKILRPGIEHAFRRDIDLFRWLATIIDSTQSYAKRLKPLEIVEKFEEISLREMDLSIEAASASKLKENFSSDDFYLVPTVDWSLTSTKVLTTERIKGISLGDRESLVEAGVDLEKLVENLLKSFLLQVFRDGFFHADLHPGNLFSDQQGNILPVDFGIMGHMDLKNRYYLAELMLAFLTRNYTRAAEIHFEAGYVPRNKSLDAFALSCRAIGESILDKPPNEVSIGRLLYQLLRTTEFFKMETQPQLLLLQKTLVVAEGVARGIGPDLILWNKAKLIIEEWMSKNLGPKAQILSNVDKTIARFRKFPILLDQIESTIEQISSEGIRLHPDTIRAVRKNERKPRNVNFWILTFFVLIGFLALVLV